MSRAPDIQPPTSERILSSALDLFALNGYDATAVREICEAAGITRPTLYHFFGSKEGLLRSLIAGGLERFTTLVESALATPGSFRDRMKIVARSAFESASKEPRLWRFMRRIVWTSPGTAESQREISNAFYRGIADRMAAAADEAVKHGEIAPGETKTRILILMGAISEIGTAHVVAGKPKLSNELADELIDTIFDGWSTWPSRPRNR